MAIITLIKPQKSGKRLNIYLDGKFSSKGRPASGWGFGIDLDNFVKLGLKVGQELSERQTEEIIKKSEFQRVYENILRFASLRPRSEREFHTWLNKHKVNMNMHDELFNRLKRLELMDDRKFAVWWIEQRKQFKFKSKRELESELKSKGINKDIIENVLSEEKVDEVQMAKGLLKKKKYRWEKLNGFEARKKKSEFLLRKGYGWDTIKKVLDTDNAFE